MECVINQELRGMGQGLWYISAKWLLKKEVVYNIKIGWANCRDFQEKVTNPQGPKLRKSTLRNVHSISSELRAESEVWPHWAQRQAQKRQKAEGVGQTFLRIWLVRRRAKGSLSPSCRFWGSAQGSPGLNNEKALESNKNWYFQ